MEKEYEFYTDHSTGEAMYRVEGEDRAYVLKPEDKEVIHKILIHSMSYYKQQYHRVQHLYYASISNIPFYNFRCARRIINCSYGINDRVPDIDKYGNCTSEVVGCPIACECKDRGVICSPKLITDLSDRELEVLERRYYQVSPEKIADELHLSIHTVNNHIRNGLKCLGFHSIEEFIRFAGKHKLFHT